MSIGPYAINLQQAVAPTTEALPRQQAGQKLPSLFSGAKVDHPTNSFYAVGIFDDPTAFQYDMAWGGAAYQKHHYAPAMNQQLPEMLEVMAPDQQPSVNFVNTQNFTYNQT